MAQPTTQLNATEQDTLVKQIGLALLRTAPSEWRRITAIYRAVGRYHELTGTVTLANESTQEWAATPDIAALFARLRAGMYREGRGTWFNARYQLDHPSSYNLEYDREEPPWSMGSPPVQAYVDELRAFPRTEDNTPEWLSQRINERQSATPPRLRVARIFDGAGPDGRPYLNRQELSAEEQNRLLRYLDEAPVVLSERGFDLDHLAPNAMNNVPIAFHTDGVWIWPAAVNFYLRKYEVAPERDLVEHIRTLGFTLPTVSEHSMQAARALLHRGAPPQNRPQGPVNHAAPPAAASPHAETTLSVTPIKVGPRYTDDEPHFEDFDTAYRQEVDRAQSANNAEAVDYQEPPFATTGPLDESFEHQQAVPESSVPQDSPHAFASTPAEPEPYGDSSPNDVDQLSAPELTNPGFRDSEFPNPELTGAEFANAEFNAVTATGDGRADAVVAPGEHSEAATQLASPVQAPVIDEAAEPALQQLQTKLDELEIPHAAYNLGQPAEYGWSLEKVADGWRVGWYDDQLVNPAVFGDAEDAAAFMLGKLILSAHTSTPTSTVDSREPLSTVDHAATEVKLVDEKNAEQYAPTAYDANEFDHRDFVNPSPEMNGVSVSDSHELLTHHSEPSYYTEPDPQNVESHRPINGEHSDLPKHDVTDSTPAETYSTPEDSAGATKYADAIGYSEPTSHQGETTMMAPVQPPMRPAFDSQPDQFRRPPQDNSPATRVVSPVSPPTPQDMSFNPSSHYSGPHRSESLHFGQPSPGAPISPQNAGPQNVGPQNVAPQNSPGSQIPEGQYSPPPTGTPPAVEQRASEQRLSDQRNNANNQWPIQPLPGEPPLTLFRGKELIELPAGSEIDRFGDSNGNLTYVVGTPFSERSLVPDWINRPYRVYRLQRSLEVLSGVAIPWFNQPGGGAAYLLPASVEELLNAGDLVELEASTPPAE